MKHAARLSILSLILALGACTVTDSPEAGREASLPAALEGRWEERLPPGIRFAGSMLVFDFSADSGFLTVHNWTDEVFCHLVEGTPVCSDPTWDHVYAITARAAGDTLDLDARFLRAAPPPTDSSEVPGSGRMIFLMDVQADPGAGDTTLVLDRVDDSAFLPGRRRIILARPPAAVADRAAPSAPVLTF
jgi:hypothetical protein